MVFTPSSSVLFASAMLEALIAAAERYPCDILIQEISDDLKQLNDKVALLGLLLGRGEALHKGE